MKKENISPFRVYVVPIMVVIVIILLVPYIIIPQLNKIKETNVKIEKRAARLEALEAKIESLESIDEKEELEQLVEMDKVVPKRKDLAALVIGVRNMIAESELLVEEMTFVPGKIATRSATVSASKKVKTTLNKKEEEQNKNKINFILKAKGKYENLITFLEKLEKAKRLIGISIVTSDYDKENQIHKFEFQIGSPFRGSEEKKDIIAEPLPKITPLHKKIYDFVINLANYTDVSIPLVPKGVENPFGEVSKPKK